MWGIFEINTVLFTIWDYPLSAAELIGTLFGLWSVALAARARVWNYPIGLINVLFFFMIFYQVQMYSDMLLQVYFFIVSLYGWWKWLHPKTHEENANHELKITTHSFRANVMIGFSIVIGAALLGTLMKQIHEILPAWFPAPAAFPYGDAFIAVCSVAAMFLLARKKLESWVLWIVVDACCVVLFYMKGIKLISLEYVVFFFIASWGLWTWWKEYKEEDHQLEQVQQRNGEVIEG